jgi:Lrp/AsnC family transcriptional regulator, leucine-responsive regulatory protein
MTKKTRPVQIDEIDLKLLQRLMTQGRATWSELAETLGLSPPATAERVRRLEERGVIKGYAALIDGETLGLSLTAFVAVTLARPKDREAFIKLINALTAVQECHHIVGEDDYLLKVRCRDTRELDDLISNEIKSLAGVVRTRTTITLSSVKESTLWPIIEEKAE